MISRFVIAINGVMLAYVMAFVNALLQLLFAYGVSINADQRSSITAFVNCGLVVVAHASHSAAKHTQSVIPAGPIDRSAENG